MERQSQNFEIRIHFSDRVIFAVGLALLASLAYYVILIGAYKLFIYESASFLSIAKGAAIAAWRVFVGRPTSASIGFWAVGGVVLFVLVAAVVLLDSVLFADSRRLKIRHVDGSRLFRGEEAVREAMAELEPMRWSGDSFTIGGVTWTNDRASKHVVIQGQTGGGKTTVIKPIIYHAIDSNDLLIVYDNKTEFTDILRAKDDPNDRKTAILGPWDKRSIYWDLAKDIFSEQDARQFAHTIVPSSKKGDDVFSLGARAIITGAVVHLMKTKRGAWLASDLYKLVNQDVKVFAKEVGKSFAEITALLSFDEAGEPVTATLNMMQNAAAFINPILAILMTSEKNERLSIREFLRQLDTGKRKKQIIILQGNKQYASLQSTLYTLFLDAACSIINSPSFAERKPDDKSVWFILDEFVQLNKLNNIKTVAEIGRSKGARLVIGYQDYSQLVETYGQETAKTLYGIPQTKIHTKLSEETAKFVSQSAGIRVVAVPQIRTDVQTGATVISYTEREEAVVKPDDFGRLKADKSGVEVLVSFGSNFYQLKQAHIETERVRPRYIPQAWTGDKISKSIKSASAKMRDKSPIKASSIESDPQLEALIIELYESVETARAALK